MLKPLKIIVSYIYKFVVIIRNWLYDKKIFPSEEISGITTIVLGNITVGGTGKTPHSEFMLDILSKDFKVALLSRGYKRKTKGFYYVETTSTAQQAGDEPLQIKRKFPEIIVAVDADRVAGIKRLHRDNPDLDVVVLDDAYQHRHLKPSLSILLCDYWRPVTRDHFIPWGSLRDTVSQKHRANIVFVTKCPTEAKPIDIRVMINEIHLYPYQYLYFSTLDYGNLKPIFDAEATPAKTKKIGAMAGIANPKLFVDYISQNFAEPQMLTFPDHHAFSKNDIAHIVNIVNANNLFITTEKDSMRLLMHKDNFSKEQRDKMFYLPVKAKFLNNGEEQLTKYIINYVRKNKSNSKLYSK